MRKHTRILITPASCWGRLTVGRKVATIVAKFMKLASVKEVKDNLSRFLRRAQKGDVVITRNGHPTAVLHSFENESELEDYLLEHDPGFIRKVEKRWTRYLKEGGIPLSHLARSPEK